MSEVEYKKCPKCGANMLIEEGVMTASIPPKYRYHCPLCGEMDFDTEKYPMPEVIHESVPVMINPLPTDWDAFRREAAKDMLTFTAQMKLTKEGAALRMVSKETAVKLAIEYADELIKQLKEK